MSTQNPVNMSKLVRMEKMSRDIGGMIGAAIEDSGGGYGFCLFMFSWNDDSEMTWISNAQQPDMIKALKEFIEKAESGEEDELSKARRWNSQQN